MASKKNNRSSKTDHVLSLLSGKSTQETAEEKAKAEEPADEPKTEGTPVPKEDDAPQSQAEEAVGESSAPDRPVKAVVPARKESEHLAAPILQVARSNEELARTIRGALEQTLEEELMLARQQEEVRPVPVRENEMEQKNPPEPAFSLQEDSIDLPEEPDPVPAATSPAPDPIPPALPELDPAGIILKDLGVESAQPRLEPPVVLQPPAAPQPEPEAQAPEAQEIPFSPRQTQLPGGERCVSLMELLVDERIGRYVKMFKLCTCPRCMADVRALALTRLPPKYMVLPSTKATSLISLYRARFESEVSNQVMMACKIVQEFPRHDR